MAIYNKYPYTDFHEMNLDWCINEVNRLSVKFDASILDTIREAIDQLFIDAAYDPDTENLTLILGVHDNG